MNWNELQEHVTHYKIQKEIKSQQSYHIPKWVKMRDYAPSFAGWYMLAKNQESVEKGVVIALNNLMNGHKLEIIT